MTDFFRMIAKQFKSFWSTLDKTKRYGFIAIISLLFLFAVGISLFLNHKEYTVLYTNLDPKDAGEILNKLTEMKVDAKPQGTGTILVPKDQDARIRMELSSQGYPKSGINYDLFMNNNGFGITDFEKEKYLLFQLQDRLQSSIKTLDGVEDAIVTISMPEQDSFVLKEDKEATTASVLLKLKGNIRLTPVQVNAIQELVEKSVLGLKRENISIIDSNMNVLNGQDDSQGQVASSQLDLETQVRDQIEKQVLSMLEPVFGIGKVVASANVKLDFDKKVQETTKYEPVIDDAGIAVSINELKEKVTNGTNGAAANVPGTTTNGTSAQYPALQQGNGNYEKTNNITNYQVNQIKEQLEKSQGQIKELSVSVIIDNPDLTQDVKDNIKQIVATTAGVDQSRVVVQNMAFNGVKSLQNQLASQEAVKQKTDVQGALVRNLVLYGSLGIFFILLLFVLWRTLKEQRPALETTNDMIAPPVAATVEDTPILLKQDEQSLVREQIDQFIRQKPETVVQMIRTWLNED